jgi:hypothetical protein
MVTSLKKLVQISQIIPDPEKKGCLILYADSNGRGQIYLDQDRLNSLIQPYGREVREGHMSLIGAIGKKAYLEEFDLLGEKTQILSPCYNSQPKTEEENELDLEMLTKDTEPPKNIGEIMQQLMEDNLIF